MESPGARVKPKLRYLLAAAFTLVSLVPVSFLEAWVQRTAFENEVAAVEEKHLLLARNITAALERYAADARAVFIHFTSLDHDLGAHGNAGDMAAQFGFRHFCVIDAQGRVVRQLDVTGMATPPLLPANLQRLRTMAQDTPVFSPVMADAQGRPSLFLVQRLDGDQIAIGLLNTDYIVELQQAIAFGQRGHAAIVDHEGNILAHPSAEWQREMKNIVKIDAVRRMVAGESGVSRFYSPVMKGDMIAGFASVAGPGWGVMVPQPMSELEEQAAEVQVLALVIALVGLTVAALVGWLLAGRLANPVAAVVRTANEMSAGNLKARVPPQSRAVPAELQELSTAFNDMAQHLQDNRMDLTEALAKAQAADRAKSEFLTNMSHELRTPLNAIIGLADMVKGELLGPLGVPAYKEYVEDIHGSGSHLLEIINDILDISRIEAGQLELKETTVDPEAIVAACERLVCVRAREAELSLVIEVGPAPPWLWADERALKQVLLNLLSNAIKFTPAGGEVRISGGIAADGGFCITVADTGIGIAEADISTVLAPFGQADTSFARMHEGTGLGLPIAKSLVELHDGRLELTSEPGSGTTVSVILPAKRLREAHPQSGEVAQTAAE